MKILKIKDMKNGWFVGNFEPTAFKNENFEVCYRVHAANEKWQSHYHKQSHEINYLIKGIMKINGQELKSGDIFIIYPYEVAANITYVTDCELIIIKTPSLPNDKFNCED